MQTANCRLKRSLLSGKYILFGTTEDDDKLIQTLFPSDFDVGVNYLSTEDLQEQINMCQQEMMDDCFMSSLDDRIIDIE